MTEILLVRHGQSVWNAQGRWQGQADPALSPLGIEQAAAAGEFLASWTKAAGFDGIATSTLDRAASTGDAIAASLGFETPYRTANLAERSAGEWSGMTRDEIDSQYPGFLQTRRYPPGYEHDAELMARVQQGFVDVLTNVPGDRLVVVAHGGIVYCIEGSLGLPFRHLTNLGARWMTVPADGDPLGVELGDRLDLLHHWGGEKTSNPGLL